MKNLVVAIDGPAASGKSSTSRLAARRLGYLYVDTGAMYRAMTLKVLERNVDIHDRHAIGRLANETEIRLEQHHSEMCVLLDQRDVTEEIRSQAVTKAVSAVSMVKEVRDLMVREQRKMGEQGSIIVEGRDIGTVVFPDADVKIFMVADVRERALRRQKELTQKGIEVNLDDLIQEIRERDQKDSQREISPLREADGALKLDTSEMTIAEQVDVIVNEVQRRQQQG